jgi:hypothetical protein
MMLWMVIRRLVLLLIGLGVWANEGVAQTKTVVDLQPFRFVSTGTGIDKKGNAFQVTLTNLNTHVNVWYLASLEDATGQTTTYHLENPYPKTQSVELQIPTTSGVVLGPDKFRCNLWGALQEARASRNVYVSLCEGRLYLRNPTKGHKTSKEWATDFLRLYVPGGETITSFVRGTVYKDAFLNTSELVEAKEFSKKRGRPDNAPARPLIDAQYENQYLIPKELGIEVKYEVDNRMLAGRWYPVVNTPGVFLSAVEPKLISNDVVMAQKGRVKPLDEVEAGALCYLVAFDLSQFDLRFAMGTEHPQVNWSDRMLPEMKDTALPGPDGIATVAPLVNTGMVNPEWGDLVVAAFTGGFKRYHGAFLRGDLATKNHGSHYGFMENGVIMSRLQPGLATVVIYNDGTVDLKTWSEADTTGLKHIRFARQNGVPIVEYDAVSRTSRPSPFVVASESGNWSGSASGSYRTLRGGVGLHESDGRRFLIYGYFSTATPSAMARVFQGYGCRYAMLTDMNALEHTYLSVYPNPEDGPFVVQHLIKGMSVLDKVNQGQVAPRFVGYADNRDFFYLLRSSLQ